MPVIPRGAEIPGIYTDPAVFQFLLFQDTGKPPPADRAADQGGKDIGVLRGRPKFGLSDLLDPVEVRRRYVWVAIIFLPLPATGIFLTLEQPVDDFRGGRPIPEQTLDMLDGPFPGIAGEVIPVRFLYDIRHGSILLDPVMDHLISVGGAHAAGHLPDGSLVVENGLDPL